MKRAGFTMIELIFVIVILGILAAVAIPKLAATRTDAKISAEMTNVGQALQNLGAEWTAQGAFVNYSSSDANRSAKCFTITDDTNGTVTITALAAETADCPDDVLTVVAARAADQNITGDHRFGGVGVSY